ncbi:hypothetical protein NE865_06479 [Phthorimaea operculella]|nr:hypothetical protein NE865_06479 [Phthorimaea operculella]
MDLSSLLSSNSDAIATLFARMGNFEERLQKATSNTPVGPADLPTLAREFQDFKHLVWQVLSKLRSQTELLSLGQDRHETFMRRKTLLFHGVPESKEEKIQDKIIQILSDKMQLPDLTSSDLQSCHRLGSSTTKARPVLVRFRDLDHHKSRRKIEVLSDLKKLMDAFPAVKDLSSLENKPKTTSKAGPVPPASSGRILRNRQP